ncbi:hypothetical protein FRC00_011368, partial [Tulasnella sp. 408]
PIRTQMLAKDALASITDAYRFMDKMKCLEANRPGIATSMDTRAALAESFVGGLALQYGAGVATQWAAEVLAWKHELAVPPSDEQRLGQRLVAGAAPRSPPPPASHPAAISPAPPPGPGPNSVRSARSTAPRAEHPQVRPPQEVPIPATEYDPPYPQYMYGRQSTYQGAPPYPQMPGMIAATTPTTYNVAPAYRPSARPLPQPVPYMQAPSSPPAAAQFPQQAAQQVDYRNFGHNGPPGAPPSFAESVSYQQSPPQAAVPQPQFQAVANNIPVWGPQVPGAGAILRGASSPSGPRAILDME